MKVVLAGIGVISPIGNKSDDFWAALLKGVSGIKPSTRFIPTTVLCAEVKDFKFNELCDSRRFRRVSAVSKYALAATGEAAAEAGIDIEKGFINSGAVVGITHGALDYSCEFHEGLMHDGPLGASPALFSDSVLNTLTGTLSLALTIKGPTHTLVGGSPVALKALALGAQMVKAGRVDSSVVCSAEILNTRAVEAYGRFGLVARGDGGLRGYGVAQPEDARGFIPSEGACTLILRPFTETRRRGEKPLAELAGCGFASGPMEKSLAWSINKALDMACLEPREIGCVFSGANGGAGDSLEGKTLGGIVSRGTPVVFIKQNIGESFGAAGAMSVAAGAIFLKEKVIPPSIDGGIDKTGWEWAVKPTSPTSTDVKNILVISTGLTGASGCVILKRL